MGMLSTDVLSIAIITVLFCKIVTKFTARETGRFSFSGRFPVYQRFHICNLKCVDHSLILLNSQFFLQLCLMDVVLIMICGFFLFPLELVNSDDPTLNFITNNPLDALLAVEIEKNKEFLLCFNCKYIRAWASLFDGLEKKNHTCSVYLFSESYCRYAGFVFFSFLRRLDMCLWGNELVLRTSHHIRAQGLFLYPAPSLWTRRLTARVDWLVLDHSWTNCAESKKWCFMFLFPPTMII